MGKWILVVLLLGVISPLYLFAQSYSWNTSIPVVVDDRSLEIPWAGGLNSAQPGTIDLNNDGINDLAIFDRTSNKFSTFLAVDNQYAFAPEYASLLPAGLKGWVLFRDFDCDGLQDIFTHAPFGIKVYRNTSNGGILSWEKAADPLFTQGFNGQVNLQVNIIDMPGIDDLDGDGDLDILVYNFAVGARIEHHKNMSMENSGSCGLEYVRVTKFWGYFEECICDYFAFDESCDDLILPGGRIKHVGGKTILTIDTDNDQAKEILIGQEDCEPLYFLKNDGTPDSARMNSFTNFFSDSLNPASYFTFPAGYYEDVDFDGKKDFLSSTNFYYNFNNEIDYQNSLWFYKNTGTNAFPDFQFQTTGFLQKDMIDIGENASPVTADFDKDGDQDLFIGTRGTIENAAFSGSIWIFENTGSHTTPSFELLDDNYIDLQSLGLTELKPQFDDLNGDGKTDLVISGTDSTRKAKMFVLYNKSSNIFSFDINELSEIVIDIKSDDKYCISDINDDNLSDILIARQSGQLDYYKNSGSSTDPEFTLIEEGFYEIIADFEKKFLTIEVADIDADGTDDLVTGDQRGQVHYYPDFLSSLNNPKPEIELPVYNSVTDAIEPINLGNSFTISFSKLYDTQEPVLIAGLMTGGIHLLQSSTSTTNPNPDDGFDVLIYPNPVYRANGGIITINSTREGEIQILNIIGQPTSRPVSIKPGTPVYFDMQSLPGGVYLFKTQSTGGKIITKQVVVIN